MSCDDKTSTRYFYTGNQVGYLNHVGELNFVGGGPPGSGISAGTTVSKVFRSALGRAPWEQDRSVLNQSLLDRSYPFLEFNWVADIRLSSGTTFRVSNKNIYVEDKDGLPRFYEARALRAPVATISLGEWMAMNFEIGDINLTLNNRDGFFNQYLPQGSQFTPWIGAEVTVKVGFGETFSNYFEVFRGKIPHKKGIETTDTDIKIQAYDRFEEDDVSIPATTFDTTNYPNVDPEKSGKALQIIYGDWTTEVGDFGAVEAICSNATDEDATQFEWNISENSLSEITDVYLHRSNRTEDRDGPVKFIDGAITKDTTGGRIIIPKGGTTLEEAVSVIERARPGVGSGLNLIIAESAEQNFISSGVLAGDIVYKEGDSTPHIVDSVVAGQLTFTDGVTFTDDDSYSILTKQYTFKQGDRISVKVRGKNVSVMSATRLLDLIPDANPNLLSMGFFQNGSFWFADNTAQEIKEITFSGEILNTISYSDIDASISELGGLAFQFDNTLWIFESNQSKIYRYVVDQSEVGLSFTTNSITGLGVTVSGGAISIDDANILTVVDNNTGNIYRVDVFAATPTVTASFNRSAFDASAVDIVDTSHDVNLNHLLVMDKSTNKVYRVNKTTGALVSTIDLDSDVSSAFTNAVGIGYLIDGTIFLLNLADSTIYNYNESSGASDNPGFIARDLLQSLAGKHSADFDLMWNETSNQDLINFKGRLIITEKTTLMKEVHRFLTQFNTSFYARFDRFSLFHINFDNFRTDGDTIREADIKLGSFKPRREINQYFNSAISKYKKNYFTEKTVQSDNYISPTGMELAGKEIQKVIELPDVYRREDVDALMPLYVRLAAADPEFVDVTLGFRFLFTQPNVFFNINFFDKIKPEQTGRRFEDIPSFVRKIQIDLETMEISLKLWSLGTTAFNGFTPVGKVAGGAGDPIVLTNLGTLGIVAPVGIITGVADDIITIEGSGSNLAEVRSSSIGGRAWKAGYKVDIVSSVTHQVLETREVVGVSGADIQLDQIPTTAVQATTKNSAGFATGGHYLKFSQITDAVLDQTKFFAYFGKPISGYPTTQSQEIEEQRAGLHSFNNGRIPYVLHPFAFTPSI